MKSFSERNPLVMGAIGIGVIACLVQLTLHYDKIPFFNNDKDYSAYFAEAGGLSGGDTVEVLGVRVGRVSSVTLDGPRVVVKFQVPGSIHLGDRTEAAVKLKSALGSKRLEITPRGDGRLTGPIPLERTTPAYQLPDALGDLTTTISGLDTDQLSKSLAVLADEFAQTGPNLKVAVQGVARLSETVDERDKELRHLLSNASTVTKVLSDRSDEIVTLVANTNELLAQLNTQSRALGQIANNISALAQQLKGVISDNRATLKPMLDKLNAVLAIVDKRKKRVQKAIKGLNAYALSLGESVGSGPFFKAYIVNLLPGQFVQPFIDAAFSDLGVDPATLLPTQRADPQTGQPATPPLPLPYPRTGQGGDPRMTLPDAITGNPADPRYPPKQEPPAPLPGGPPPGPPASVRPGPGQSPGAVEYPAPGQLAPNQPSAPADLAPVDLPSTPPGTATGGAR